MKKLFAMIFVASLLAACGDASEEATPEADTEETTGTDETTGNEENTGTDENTADATAEASANNDAAPEAE